jgi:signal peptidase II
MDSTSAESGPQAPVPPPPSARRGLHPAALAVAVALLAVDQLTKWLAVNHLREPVELIWTLRLALTYNTGTAFSLGLGLGPVIGVLAVVIVVVLARLGRAVVSPLGVVALGLVMGGAVGNLADRVLRSDGGLLDGAVVDFIDLQWWPVFNVADMGIVVGGVLLAASGFGTGDRRAAPNGTAAGEGAPTGAGPSGEAPAGHHAPDDDDAPAAGPGRRVGDRPGAGP